LCPDAIVTGKEIPLTENPVPVMPAEVTLTEPPLAVSVALCFRFDPTVTLPKLRVAGLTLSCQAGTVLPEPVSGTDRDELAALEVIDRVPLAAPLDVGPKATLNVKL